MVNKKIKPAERTSKIRTEENWVEMDSELNARLQTFDFIFDNIPEGLIFTDQNGYIIQINQSAATYLGEQLDGVVPEEWSRKFGFYLDDAKTYYPGQNMPLVRALQGETVQSEEIGLHHPVETGCE